MNSIQIIVLISLQLCLVLADRLQYILTDENGVKFESPIENRASCYKLTWIGVVDDERNSTSCSDYYPEHICNPPLVLSQGANALNGPNLTALIEQCRSDPSGCDETQFYCKRDAGEVCIKYSRYTKSGEVDYYSSFCGRGVDKGWKSRPITSGCHKQIVNLTKSTYDVEACFCEEENCNFAQNVIPMVWIILGLSIILVI